MNQAHPQPETPSPRSPEQGSKTSDGRSRRRDARRLAMQLLYQMGHGTDASETALREHLSDVTPEEEDGLGVDPPAVHDEAVPLALAAWAGTAQADAAINDLSPDWPVNRQPAVDRSILRLAYFELSTQRVPASVAINEAVELAKAYAGENSPAFVNGVLDKLAKQLGTGVNSASSSVPNASSSTAASPDQWLKDAVAESSAE